MDIFLLRRYSSCASIYPHEWNGNYASICYLFKTCEILYLKLSNSKTSGRDWDYIEQENNRTMRLCPFLWKTIIVAVHFAQYMVIYYTYNQL